MRALQLGLDAARRNVVAENVGPGHGGQQFARIRQRPRVAGPQIEAIGRHLLSIDEGGGDIRDEGRVGKPGVAVAKGHELRRRVPDRVRRRSREIGQADCRNDLVLELDVVIIEGRRPALDRFQDEARGIVVRLFRLQVLVAALQVTGVEVARVRSRGCRCHVLRRGLIRRAVGVADRAIQWIPDVGQVECGAGVAGLGDEGRPESRAGGASQRELLDRRPLHADLGVPGVVVRRVVVVVAQRTIEFQVLQHRRRQFRVHAGVVLAADGIGCGSDNADRAGLAYSGVRRRKVSIHVGRADGEAQRAALQLHQVARSRSLDEAQIVPVIVGDGRADEVLLLPRVAAGQKIRVRHVVQGAKQVAPRDPAVIRNNVGDVRVTRRSVDIPAPRRSGCLRHEAARTHLFAG